MRPIDYVALLSPPDRSRDWVPFVDLAFLGLFAAIAGSELVLPPGVEVDLLRSRGEARPGVAVEGAVTVITVREGERVLFDGQVIELGRAGEALARHVAERGAQGGVLLVMADRSVRLEPVLALCDEARRAGFGSVQLATREELERAAWEGEPRQP